LRTSKLQQLIRLGSLVLEPVREPIEWDQAFVMQG
jgi:hypothetical protein